MIFSNAKLTNINNLRNYEHMFYWNADKISVCDHLIKGIVFLFIFNTNETKFQKSVIICESSYNVMESKIVKTRQAMKIICYEEKGFTPLFHFFISYREHECGKTMKVLSWSKYTHLFSFQK